MINIETIKFMRMLDELAELSLEGIEPFDNATPSTWGSKIFYDTSAEFDGGGYKMVLEAWVSKDHHDIISYYDDNGSFEYTIKVIVDEEGIPYVDIKLLISDSEIVIERGRWYFC